MLNRLRQLIQSNRVAEAEKLGQHILARTPQDGEALYLTALALNAQGKRAAALALLKQAIKIPSPQPVHYDTLGILQLHAQDNPAAVTTYREARKRFPREPGLARNLGCALQQQGQFDDAIDQYRDALSLNPADADSANNLGLCLKESGHLDEAIAHFQQAAKQYPRDVRLLINLGNCHQQNQQHEAAQAAYRAALQRAPQSADALRNLAHSLSETGPAPEARELWKQLLTLAPRDVDVLNEAAAALAGLGEWRLALNILETALKTAPNHAETHNNLGTVLFEAQQIELALEHYRKALKLAPQSETSRLNLAKALADHGKHHPESRREALKLYDAILKKNPENHQAFILRRSLMRRLCDWRNFTEEEKRFLELARREGIDPFNLLANTEAHPEDHKSAAERLAQSYVEKARKSALEQRPPAPPASDGRCRIGYLSADFHAHATAYLMAAVFEQHDRNRFEIKAFSCGPRTGDAMEARLEAAFDHFIRLPLGLSAEEGARLIAQEGVDILVDLKGYTQFSRPDILALRPAPVQVHYLGYPGTLGAPFIDYLISDEVVSPREQAMYYSEALAYLPDSYQCNDRTRPLLPPPLRAECGLPEQGFVYCCFNQHYKITPQVFEHWCRILRRVPGSILWLLDEGPLSRANLLQEAKTRGISAERLVFAAKVDQGAHLARLQQADLMLDTLPVNAHTTASDALWAGVPVLTTPGECFASRVAASLLHAIGLPELVTPNLNSHEETAVALALDGRRFNAIKEKLAEGRLTAPLFDSERTTRHLEVLYTQMWERHRAQQPPALLDCLHPTQPGE